MRTLEVRLDAGSEPRAVGLLVERDRRIFFEYAPEFLRDPRWLSPFKLPPEPGLIEHRDREFGPVFGLFDDSLPDGWGLLLMNRAFLRAGFDPAAASPLDRLAWLGTRTMGALTYHPPTDFEAIEPTRLDLHALAAAATQVLEGATLRGAAGDVLPQLLRAGGSPGGARPKVLAGFSDSEILSGEDALPPGFRHGLIKFHALEDGPDAGAIEFAYASMARACGIRVPPTHLFETSAGERFFGVERFDRLDNGRRIHVHTFGNLIQSNFRIPSCDYRQFLEVTRILTRRHDDAVEAYRRMVFNVLAHNRDDHVKNFAFMLPDDEWRLTPAYDLVFSSGPGGEHTMTVAGEGRAPGREHLLHLARPAGLSKREAEGVLETVASAVADWPVHARDAGVGRVASERIRAKLAG